MIDSVILRLDSGQFWLKESNQFDGSKNQSERGFKNKTLYINNFVRQKKKDGIYCPKVNLLKSKQGKMGEVKRVLDIQVSLPKLIYGTNLYEVDDNDLELIYSRLNGFLIEIGVNTSIDELKRAVVKRVDFSKVIRLPDYLGRADEVIYFLSRFNYKQQSNFDFKEFRIGGGSCIKFINKTQGYAIYDKFGQILADGNTEMEKKIIEQFNLGKIKRNAVKFEISLHRKSSLESVIKRRLSHKKKDFFLVDILNRNLAIGILLETFDKVFNDLPVGLISLGEMEDNKLRAYLAGSVISQSKQEKLYFWVRMATRIGYKGAMEELGRRYSGGSVARQKREIALIIQELGEISGNTPNLIRFLRDRHEQFELIKPKQVVNHC